MIYIGLRPAIFARFARVGKIAQNSSNIAVNGVAKIQQNECGIWLTVWLDETIILT